MERKKTIFELALTSFLPGVLSVMALTVGLILILSSMRFNVLSEMNWRLFILEMFLLTSGFLLTSLILKDKIALKRGRVFLAGIGSLILLGIFSIFTQGASLWMIVMLSVTAGMISGLTLLSFGKQRML